MNNTVRIWRAIIGTAGFVCLLQCSPNQNTVTSDIYHNTTAHFNGYFYAKEKILEIENTILQSQDDDPNQILRLFPKLDTTLARSFKKDTEEVIKMSSISIQRHPNSKWLDDNYLLVGLARLYDCDFQNAIQTFKYVNTKGQDIQVRHRAIVHLIRTFTEQGDYPRAEEAFQFLEKEELSAKNSKDFYLEKAYFYQLRGDYDNMVRNLAAADTLLTRADRKGRIYFIIGQVYQQLGFGSEAYSYYRKCLATNPAYEIDFYARLNMAQVAELDDDKSRRLIRKQFERMLKDTKNEEFKDKIYYELGEFERKQGNLDKAIAQYKLSAHSGKNRRIQGTSFLRIGEICFDSLRKYSMAKAYYDSAIASLPKETEGFEAISKRQRVLGDFVTYSETIQWQDSLLSLALLDSVTLRTRVDSALAARIPKDDGKKKKRRREAVSADARQGNSFFPAESTSTTDWYFGNLSAVSSGQSEFRRIWGNIGLEDNWRRSTKSAAIGPQTVAGEPVAATQQTGAVPGAETAAATPDNAFQNLYTAIPYSDEAKKEAYVKIEEAYFKLGDLYYFQLEEKENALESYTTLLDRFPSSEYKPEVLYKLYLIHKERGDDVAARLADQLQREFPNSTFTKILLNPDYLRETTVAQEKQKLIYRDAYAEFQRNNLRGTQEKLKQAQLVGETQFTPQLELLQILVTGKTEDVTRYQFELGEFMKKYPEGKLHAYAGELLASSKAFLEKTERAKGIRFVASFEEPHYFVILHRIADQASGPISQRLDKLSQDQFKALKLVATNLIFDEQYAMTFVGDLPSMEGAMEYLKRFTEGPAVERPFSTLNFHNFVITKDNFNIFYRNKALDEYLSFFDRYYKK
jgi:tetratricopeptide (TPR) repeat protein